jgi:hypothetical protein
MVTGLFTKALSKGKTAAFCAGGEVPGRLRSISFSPVDIRRGSP